MIKKLMSCVGKYKIYAILSPVFIIGEVLMEILIPLVMAQIIDVGIQGDGGLSYVIKMGALMIAMAVLSLTFGALSSRMAAVASVGFARNLRQKLFYKVQDFSFANVDRFSTASLITRLTTDVTNTQNAFQMIIRVTVRAPIMFLGALILSISINAELAAVFLVAIPLIVVALYFISTRAYPRFRAMLSKYDGLNSMVQENLIAIRAVKAFVREDYETEKFEASADGLRRAQVHAEKLLILSSPLMQFVMYGCIVAVLWLGGNMVIGGTFEIGQLSSFITYITQILMSLMMVAMIFVMLVMSRASAARIVEVLDEEIDIKDSELSVKDVADGSIEFRDVSFSYQKDSDTAALEHINLSIRSGETVGIIGGTGSAKTTLVQLIPRLYDVTAGELRVGGRNVKDYHLDTLRNQVAMVLQKNVLFSGSVRENLQWGNAQATDEEILEACKNAQAYDFVMALPGGLDFDLGQGGVNVSGGQKQRLCIARALLKKPKIIILDDSTSAVDTATDSKIRAAFREKLRDTTTIIIAQRVTSISDADKIVVLDDGKINAIGTHEQLLATNEIYREVYHSQQKGVEDDAGTK